MKPLQNLILLFVVAVFASSALPAEAGYFGGERYGPYLGLDAGIAVQQDLKVRGTDNDVPTRCDQILRKFAPDAEKSQFSPLTEQTLSGECRRGQDFWESEADPGAGVIVGGQFGWIFGNVRIEAEYTYRDHNSSKQNNEASIETKSAELVNNTQSVSNISSHSVFANFYYDFVNNSSVTPYLGFGAGWANISMIYDATFTRNPNPESLPDTTPDFAAGTTTTTQDKLSDDVFGWQLIAGTDYELDKNWSIGLKLRFSRFRGLEDTGNKWDQLRGHISAIAEDGDVSVAGFDPTVRYRIKTPNMSVWSASLNLKYKFGRGKTQ